MKTARIVKFNDRSLVVQDAEGGEAEYLKDEGLESPAPVHADFLWPKGFEKSTFQYEGELPKSIFVKDGGLPLHHTAKRASPLPETD